MLLPLIIGLVSVLGPTTEPLDDTLDRARAGLESLDQARSRVEQSLERTALDGRELSELLQQVTAPLPEPPPAIETYPDEGPDELKARFEAWRDHFALLEQRALASGRSRERRDAQVEDFAELRTWATSLVNAIAVAESALSAADQLVATTELDAEEAASATGLDTWSQREDKLDEARALSAGLSERIDAMVEAEEATLTALSKVEGVEDDLLAEVRVQRDASEILMSVVLIERGKRDALVAQGEAGLQIALARADEPSGAVEDLERLRIESREAWAELRSIERARVARTPPSRADFAADEGDGDVGNARSELAWGEAMVAYHRETLEVLADRRARLVSLHESMVAGKETVRTAGLAVARIRMGPQVRALLTDPTGALSVEYPRVAGQDAWDVLKSIIVSEARRTLVQQELERRLDTTDLRDSATEALAARLEAVTRARRSLLESEAYVSLLAEMAALSDSALTSELDPRGEGVAAVQEARRAAEISERELASMGATLPAIVGRVASLATPYVQRRITSNPGRTQEIRKELEALAENEALLLPANTSGPEYRQDAVPARASRPVESDGSELEEELLSPSNAQLRALSLAQRAAQESLGYYLRLEALVAELREASDAYTRSIEAAREAVGARIAGERRLYAAGAEVQRRRQSGALPDARVPKNLVTTLSLSEIVELVDARKELGVATDVIRGILRDELKREERVLAWKPWAVVGGDVAQQTINLIARPVLHVEAARRTVDDLPEFERGNLEYTAHELVLSERSGIERILAPLAKAERRQRFDATLEAYYLAVVNFERIATEYGRAQDAYRELIELTAASDDELRGALEAMHELEQTRLLDYEETLIFAAIAANPSRRIRIVAEYGQNLPTLIDNRNWDQLFWAGALASAESRLWGDRARIAELEHSLSREGIESDINAFETHIAHIGTEIKENEALAETLRTRIEELRANYRDELTRNAFWTLLKVASIPLLALLAVRALKRVSAKIQANTRGVVGSPDRVRRLETLTNVSTASIRAVVWVVAGIYMLAFLGLDITPILASASVIGLAVAFGAQTLVKDFFAGFFLLLEHQYSVGDVVDLGIASGKVEQISLRMTTLRDLKGVVHYVPNGLVQRVANKTKGWSQIILEVGVPYGEDIDRVTAILQEELKALAADEDLGSNILGTPSVAGVEALGESRIDMRLMVKVLPGEQWGMARALRRRIRRRFDAEGIKAPYPQRIVHRLDDGPSSAAPTPDSKSDEAER